MKPGFVEIQKSESARGERSSACCCCEASWKLIVVHNKSERRFSLVNLLFQRVLPLKGISLFTGALSALCSRLTFSFVVDLQTCDVTRKLIPLGVLFSRVSRQSCEVELKLVSKGKFLLFPARRYFSFLPPPLALTWVEKTFTHGFPASPSSGGISEEQGAHIRLCLRWSGASRRWQNN